MRLTRVRVGPACTRGVVLLVLVGAVAACGSTGRPDRTAAAAEPSPRITGRLELMDMPTADHPMSNVVQQAGGACQVGGSQRDLDTGSPVTLYDESGAVLSTAVLSRGRTGTDEYSCTFTFDFGDVRAQSSKYGIEISRRGTAWVSQAVLAANRYTFTLALGGM